MSISPGKLDRKKANKYAQTGNNFNRRQELYEFATVFGWW